MKRTLPFFFFFLAFINGIGQCDEGFVSVELRVFTDTWPYETYWQLNTGGSACGENVIAEGANSNVNCAGTAADNSPDGYGANTNYWEGPFCLAAGQEYNLIFVDSYGDGGLVFEVYENGQLSGLYVGGGNGNVWSFTPGSNLIPAYDQPCNAEEVVPDAGPIILDNTYAIAAYGEIAPAGGGCGGLGTWCEGGSTKSVWAFFQPQPNTAYEITTCGDLPGFDTQIALWKYVDCGDFSTYELISANDDMAGGCATSNGYSSKLYASCLNENEFYLIQVDGYYGEAGEFALEVNTFGAAPILTATVNNINCPTNKGEIPTGSITPYVIGSGLDFTSVWTGPNGFFSDANNINELAPGQYQLTVTTACGETLNQNFTINEPGFWNVFLTAEAPTCQSSTDGEITANVSGATPPYNYAWTGPADFTSGGGSVSNIGAGEYFLQITDDNGCVFTSNYNLVALNDFEFELGGPVNLCVDETYTINPPEVYNYLWFDGSAEDTYTIDAETWGVGNHTILVTVSDNNGCNDISSFSFFVSDCVNLDEQEIEVAVFPNPWAEQLTIQTGNITGETFVQLFDTAGRMVYSASFSGNQHTVNEALSQGVYHLTLRNDQRFYSTSVIKK